MVWHCCFLFVQFLEIMQKMVEAMDDPTRQFDEKREHRRLPICRRIRFGVSVNLYRGLIGDISCEGISIISKHRFILGSVVDLNIPPMSGTVQYCIPYKKDFFKTGLRLLETIINCKCADQRVPVAAGHS